MRDFSRSIMMRTGAALVAGFMAIAMAAPASAASTAPAASPGSGDSVARPDPSIAEAAPVTPVDMDIVACAIMPPIPERTSAQVRPGAASVGNAGGRATK
jgi:hypothetical protein